MGLAYNIEEIPRDPWERWKVKREISKKPI